MPCLFTSIDIRLGTLLSLAVLYRRRVVRFPLRSKSISVKIIQNLVESKEYQIYSQAIMQGYCFQSYA